MIEILTLIFTILNLFGIAFLLIFKLGERVGEMRVRKYVENMKDQPSPAMQERVEFPPPPSPPLEEETEVVTGSAQEEELMESTTEESSEEREYFAEQKRISQRGQI